MTIFVLLGRCRTHAPPLVTWLFPLVEATPPAQLLANGATTGWFPLPDSIPAPDLGTMCSLLAEHFKRLKGSSSSVLDMVAKAFLKYAICYVPRAEVRGFDAVHVLLPLLAQIFLLSFESARVPDDWSVAKITLLYKKGPMLDPNSYRMLAVSGIFVQIVHKYHSLPAYNLVRIKKQDTGHTVWFLPRPEHPTAHVHP